MVIANIWLRIAAISPPAALRLMKAWQPNVDGKRYEKYFQNAGKAAVVELQGKFTYNCLNSVLLNYLFCIVKGSDWLHDVR